MQLLERRLDNTIFKLGIGLSRPQARQIVRHKFISVNSRIVNIPSFLVNKEDVIEIKAKEQPLKKLRENLEQAKDRTVPSWLEFDLTALKAKVLRLPEKDDIPVVIQEQLIVELYSK